MLTGRKVRIIGMFCVMVFLLSLCTVGFAKNTEPTDAGEESMTEVTEEVLADGETPEEETAAENKEAVQEDATANKPWKYPVPKEAKNGKHQPYLEMGGVRFGPYDYLTRSEFCSIYFAAFQVYDNGVSPAFADVAQDAWYYPYVISLAEAGVVGGYPDGTFRPENLLSRAEFVAILSKAYEVQEGASTFTDTVGHWAENQIAFANQKGWTHGYDDGTFRPGDPITRAEAIAIVNRVLGRSAAGSREMLLEKNVAPFYDVMPYDWFYGDVMEATVAHEAEGRSQENSWKTFSYPETGLTEGIHAIDGNGCTVDENGQFTRHEANAMIALDEKTYFTNALGFIDLSHPGVWERESGLYYCNEDGSLLTDGMYGNLYFGADGRYTTGNPELDGLVEEALAKCTTVDMAPWEKLRASYLFLRDNCKYLSRPHHPRGATDFAEESATFMFRNMKGNCYCYSACFLYMARRIGYADAAIVSGGVGTNNSDHAWVMIDSKIFDPELEYAYRYKYANKREYNLYDMSVDRTPFPYYFPN